MKKAPNWFTDEVIATQRETVQKPGFAIFIFKIL
jgi:hypothetical protein